jgi:cycloeucalenol cycloisomerase
MAAPVTAASATTTSPKLPKLRLFSQNVAKAWTEQLFLVWGLVWVLSFALVVVTGVYHSFGDLGYLLIGLYVSLPYVVLPYFLDPPQYLVPPAPHQLSTLRFDRWASARYWVKANVWIAIFSFVGNYFWTHYFYHVLGAAYSFPVEFNLNGVPFFLYLITHAYFCFYHSLTNIAIRLARGTRFYHGLTSPVARLAFNTLLVFALAVFTAFMETWTIASVPYYSHQDKWSMYTVGSVFYGIYFFASFPMFFRLDEPQGTSLTSWTLAETITDSLAACMIVTIFLDLWRLVLCAWMPSLIANSSACASIPVLVHAS